MTSEKNLTKKLKYIEMKKFKVCKLGGTGCKYWNEFYNRCINNKYKDNPELCENYPYIGEHTLEEIEEGKKENRKQIKEQKKAVWSLINNLKDTIL